MPPLLRTRRPQRRRSPIKLPTIPLLPLRLYRVAKRGRHKTQWACTGAWSPAAVVCMLLVVVAAAVFIVIAVHAANGIGDVVVRVGDGDLGSMAPTARVETVEVPRSV